MMCLSAFFRKFQFHYMLSETGKHFVPFAFLHII